MKSPPLTKAADLKNIESMNAAPSVINISGMQNKFDSLWKDSFPGGRSRESGGVIVARSDGGLTVTNTGTGDSSGSYSPNLDVLGDRDIVGVFHTHPYDETEGSYENASLSGADATYMINNDQNIVIAQSGEGQYAFVRTKQTPAEVDYEALNAEHNKLVDDLLSKEGYTFDKATQAAAEATATKYGLAYYEGKNGILSIVHH